MNVDLSNPEIDLLDKALKLWAEEPIGRGMHSSLLGAVLGNQMGSTKEQVRQEARREMEEAKEECRCRERTALPLRAKMMQAKNRQSEHDLSPQGGLPMSAPGPGTKEAGPFPDRP